MEVGSGSSDVMDNQECPFLEPLGCGADYVAGSWVNNILSGVAECVLGDLRNMEVP